MSEPGDEFPRAKPHQRFSDFELLATIGRGGSAEVFRARNLTFEVEVALKRWYRPPTPDEQRKFFDECRLHWQISDHPNVVRLYWAEAVRGERPWLATELYEESLADRVARGAPGAQESWRIALDVLSGLAAIHERNHLHRDVKPANVLLKGGRAALCDLGISMPAGGVTRFNAAGTDDYVAPELVAGATPSFRSDVYSAGRTIGGLFAEHRPPRVAALLRRATSPEPGRRPADATAFLAELKEAAGRRNLITRYRIAIAVGVVVLAVGTAALVMAAPAGGPAPLTLSPAPSVASPAASSPAASPGPSLSELSGPKVTPSPAVPCANRVAPGRAVKLSRRLVSTPSGATIETNGGTTTVRFENQYTWAGLFLKLPKGTCRYRLDLEARLEEPLRTMNDGEGWGYGIGACNVLTEGRPFGYSLQNAKIRVGGVVSGNSGTFRNPDVNDGKVLDVPADYGWHQWTFEVEDGQVRVTREFGVAVTTGRVSGGSGLPESCDSAGIFLRVFNGGASFRQISVTGL